MLGPSVAVGSRKRGRPRANARHIRSKPSARPPMIGFIRSMPLIQRWGFDLTAADGWVLFADIPAPHLQRGPFVFCEIMRLSPIIGCRVDPLGARAHPGHSTTRAYVGSGYIQDVGLPMPVPSVPLYGVDRRVDGAPYELAVAAWFGGIHGSSPMNSYVRLGAAFGQTNYTRDSGTPRSRV